MSEPLLASFVAFSESKETVNASLVLMLSGATADGAGRGE